MEEGQDNRSVNDCIIELLDNYSKEYQYTEYYSRTVQEVYPQIFAWLDLLDINIWVILILMTGVAGFTMISGLLIIILERANMIGVLKPWEPTIPPSRNCSSLSPSSSSGKECCGGISWRWSSVWFNTCSSPSDSTKAFTTFRTFHRTEPRNLAPAERLYTDYIRMRTGRSFVPDQPHPSGEIHPV